MQIMVSFNICSLALQYDTFTAAQADECSAYSQWGFIWYRRATHAWENFAWDRL